jgi:hypothetical protein
MNQDNLEDTMGTDQCKNNLSYAKIIGRHKDSEDGKIMMKPG